MKSYFSISKEIVHGSAFYAFDKLDGSNIRAEWSRKHKEFTKFGSRNVLLGADHPVLGKAIEMVKTKYEKDLTGVFLKEGFEETVCFFEFFGEKSFAGNHDPEDPTQQVVLFDINVHKKGYLFPQEFLKLTKNVHTPELLYHGNASPEFVEQVHTGTLEEMTFEGVVCKCSSVLKKGYPPTYFKIKSHKWLEKLKTFCDTQGNPELFEQLS
jgi:RNA ligase